MADGLMKDNKMNNKRLNPFLVGIISFLGFILIIFMIFSYTYELKNKINELKEAKNEYVKRTSIEDYYLSHKYCLSAVSYALKQCYKDDEICYEKIAKQHCKDK